MSITGKGQLSQQEIDKILAGLVQHGARVEMKDPRVSAVNTWVLASVGSILIAIGGWGVMSINRLSETIAILVERNSQKDRVDNAQDVRLSGYDERLRQVEREVYVRK